MDRDFVIRFLAELLNEADAQRRTRCSSKEMAGRFGVGYRAFLRGLKADPGATDCAVKIPRGGGQAPILRWRWWELERRWSNGVPQRRRKARTGEMR